MSVFLDSEIEKCQWRCERKRATRINKVARQVLILPCLVSKFEMKIKFFTRYQDNIKIVKIIGLVKIIDF